MRVLAVIPAKAYSTRFGGCKNLEEWRGKTLLAHAIASAVDCARTLVITDSSEVQEEASRYGSEVATVTIEPTSTVLDTLKRNLSDRFLEGVDAIALLLPTCPRRTRVHVTQALTILREQECEGVVSICKTEWPASLACHLEENGALRPAPRFLFGDTRGQDQPPSFRPNGGIYLRYVSAWLRNPNFFAGVIWPYLMPRADSYDVDTPADLDRLRRDYP